MVEVPDRPLAEHIIIQAREYGTFGDVVDTYSEHVKDHDHDLEWSLADLDPETCDVDIDDETVVVTGEVEGEYSVKVLDARRNPPGKAHPAEYENRTIPVAITIEYQLAENLPEPTINTWPA